MNNEFAIATVTLTLRDLLDKIKDIKDSGEFSQIPIDARPTSEVLVTNLPLDEAYEADKSKNYVNLFLYHVEHSKDWRNRDLPGTVKPGETGFPPLALNLYYIITTYGQNGNEVISHLLLGKAMSILHDHALLGRDELKIAFELSGVHQQVERLRISPQPISLDEVSKLWSGFQTQYRLSAAYEVSVVFIESKHPATAPLPVLTLGKDDKGVSLQTGLIPPLPAITAATPPNQQPGALPGDLLTIAGRNLEGDTVSVRFMNPHLAQPIEVSPEPGGTASKLTVTLPNQPAQWPAGLYTLEVVVTTGGGPKVTNKMPLAILPRINTINIAPTSPPAVGKYIATITCTPQVMPEQTVSLLLGSQEFRAETHPAQTGTLTFRLYDVADGVYFTRLRVDGVDTLLIDRSVTPPVFNNTQKVTIP